MKKLKYFSLMCLLLFVGMFLASCNNNSLISPSNLQVDVENRLTWDKVKEARSYVIEVSAVGSTAEDAVKEFTTRKTYYSLSKLDEGDYVIRMKSVGDIEGNVVSNWSDTIDFHRDYESGCTYKLINNNTAYQITNGRATVGDIHIDAIYRGKPVISIADGAFKGNTSLTSITLADSIVSIGSNAFYNCTALTSIKLPSKLQSLGEAAFQRCKLLTSITIPDTVKTIEANTFAYCYGLNDIKIPNTVTSIGEKAFYNCTSITSFTLPTELTTLGVSAFAGNEALKTVKINSKLTAIPDYSFYQNKALTTVEFAEENNVSSIGTFAFSECLSLKEINVPEGVLKIDAAAFASSDDLEKVSLPNTLVKLGQRCFDGTAIYDIQEKEGYQLIYVDNWVVGYIPGENPIVKLNKDVVVSTTEGLCDYLFFDQPNLAVVNLPNSVRTIGEYCFYACQAALYSVTCNPEYVWNNAFGECSVLSSVSIGERLLYIGNYAFYNCKALGKTTDITLPDTVQKIGTRAYQGSGLWEREETKDENGGLIYAGNWLVGVVKDSVSYELRSGTIGVCDYCFYKNAAVSTISGFSSVRYIGYGAFYSCSALTSIALGRYIKSLDDFAFYKCVALNSVELPYNFTEIGYKSFYKCTSLIEMDFSETKLSYIDDYAFYGCSALQTIVFPEETLEYIGEAAFYKNENLLSLDLPNSLTTLGNKAFSKCTRLESLTIGSGLTYIPEHAFNATGLTEVVIPENIKTIGKYAFYKATGITNVVFSEGLENISAYAFLGLENITELNLPSSIEYVASFAFKGCTGLTSIFLSKEIDEVAQHAFYGCLNLTIYTDAESLPENWHKMYNSSYRPEVFGCVMEDGYVKELTIVEGTFGHVSSNSILADPLRDGYTFGGWQMTVVDENGVESTIVVKTADIPALIVGNKLVAIWNALS